MEIEMNDRDPNIKKIKDCIEMNSIFGGFADIKIEKNLTTNILSMHMSVCMCGGKGYHHYNTKIIEYSNEIGTLNYVLENIDILKFLIEKFDYELLRAASKASKVIKSSVKLDRIEFKMPKKEE